VDPAASFDVDPCEFVGREADRFGLLVGPPALFLAARGAAPLAEPNVAAVLWTVGVESVVASADSLRQDVSDLHAGAVEQGHSNLAVTRWVQSEGPVELSAFTDFDGRHEWRLEVVVAALGAGEVTGCLSV